MFDCANLINSNSFTEDQNNAIETIFNFLNSKDDILIVDGAAGTGKTYIVAKIIEYLFSEKSNYAITQNNVFLAAPTGKASLVLTEKLKTLNLPKTASTIHSLIYEPTNKLKETKKAKSPNDDDSFDKAIFGMRSNREAKNTIYFIDESSMISDAENEDDFVSFGSGKLLSDLFSFVWENRESGNKIIFIGDSNQLSPINQECSPALSEEILTKKEYLSGVHFSVLKCSLREVVRQEKESFILKAAHNIIYNIENNIVNCFDISDSEDIRKFNNEQEFIQAYLNATKKNYDDAIMISYTNKECYYYNKAVREHLFENANELQIYDKLICNNNSRMYSLFNGQIGYVNKILSDVTERTVNIKLRKENQKNSYDNNPNVRRINDLYVEVTLKFRKIEFACNGVIEPCMIIENLLYSPDRTFSHEERIALDVDFMKRKGNPVGDRKAELMLEDPYINALQVKFGHAITCHKAQGSEWKYVLINVMQTKKFDSFYYRWLYTALTRCKKKVGLLNFHKKTPISNLQFYNSQMGDLKQKSSDSLELPLDSIQSNKTEKKYYISDGISKSKIISELVMSIVQKYGGKVNFQKTEEYFESFNIEVNSNVCDIKIGHKKNWKISSIQGIDSVVDENLKKDLNSLINRRFLWEDKDTLMKQITKDFFHKFISDINEIVEKQNVYLCGVKQLEFEIQATYSNFYEDSMLKLNITGTNECRKCTFNNNNSVAKIIGKAIENLKQ